MAQQDQIKLAHLFVERIAAWIGRINPHCVRQPLHDAGATLGPFLQLLERVGPVRMNGDVGNEEVRILLGQREHILVGHIKLGLLKIHRAVWAIVFIKSQQPMFTMMSDVFYETSKPLHKLDVGLLNIVHAGRA